MLVAQANAIYRWDRFYIPFGLNYSVPNLNRSPDAVGTLQVTGGVGAQLGVGFYCSDKLALELLSKAEAVSMKGVASGYSFDYGNGYLSGAELQLRLEF